MRTIFLNIFYLNKGSGSGYSKLAPALMPGGLPGTGYTIDPESNGIARIYLNMPQGKPLYTRLPSKACQLIR